MNLKTTYMGLDLKNPIIASASPLSGGLDTIKQLEDGGAAAIVTSSLYEERVRQEDAMLSDLMDLGTYSYAESLSYFAESPCVHPAAEEYLDLIRRVSETVDLPVIASLNCVTLESWVAYAKQIEQAGAAAIELNIHAIEANLDIIGAEVEQRYLDILDAVKSSVDIPVAVKLGSSFSAMGNMAKRLDQTGADALVLFNTFYQPDIDVSCLEASRVFNLSPAGSIHSPLLWIALLHGKLDASLAATRGVETPEDVIKYLLAGADVVMTASALLRNGPAHTAKLLDGLRQWMEARGFASVSQFRGSISHGRIANPEVFHKANWPRAL